MTNEHKALLLDLAGTHVRSALRSPEGMWTVTGDKPADDPEATHDPQCASTDLALSLVMVLSLAGVKAQCQACLTPVPFAEITLLDNRARICGRCLEDGVPIQKNPDKSLTPEQMQECHDRTREANFHFGVVPVLPEQPLIAWGPRFASQEIPKPAPPTPQVVMMSVSCENHNAQRFIDMGFQVTSVQHGCTDLHQENPPDGHESGMPEDFPYHGWREPGNCLKGVKFACDGQEYVEWEDGFDGGWVFSDTRGFNALRTEFDRFRGFERIHDRVVEQMRALRTPLDA